jgi:hypothetical protein
MLDFDVKVSDLKNVELVVIQGLVLPKGSVVRIGSTYTYSLPSLETVQAAFKQLMGIKKKRVVVEDESDASVKKDNNSSDDESEISDASEAPTEIVESDND